MPKKKGQNSGSNNNNNNNVNNTGKKGGKGKKSKKTKAKSNNGKNGGGKQNNFNSTPLSEIIEIMRLQQEATIGNFGSSELTYNGSDRIVFIVNGDPIKTIWKKILWKKDLWNQNDARNFVSSALVAADSRTGHEIEVLVEELGNPEGGIQRLREVMNFSSMSCDAGLNDRVLSFQFVILPLLGLLTRTAITECILETYVHAIFMVVYENLDSFLNKNVMKMLETLVQRNSVIDNQVSMEELLSRDRYSFIPYSLGIFFLVIVRLLTEILRRIRKASVDKTMHKIVGDLQRLKTIYQQSIQLTVQKSCPDPLINSLETREYFFMILEKEMKNMNKMLNISNEKNFNSNSYSRYREFSSKFDITKSFDLPGELSKDGVRHDNDYVEISNISVIPTRGETLCNRQPFLPSPIPGTPHFLPDGAARLLDTQFRLLREDMLNPLRGGISSFLKELLKGQPSTELKKILQEGGRYTYNNGLNDNGDLQVYTHAQFINITCDRKKGLACTVRFTFPKIRGAKDEFDRKEYWEKSKKLLVGGLVALLLPSNVFKNNYSIYFGIVTSRDERILAKYDDHADIDINIIDPSIYYIALNEISNYDRITDQSLENRFLVESTSIYLEAYYHILKTLQTMNPSSLPFEKYLAPNSDNRRESSAIDIKVKNPMYTRAPGFQFDLSVLCKKRGQSLKLVVANRNSYDEVAKKVTAFSKLDDTQAKALITALTREIALIEGPPGTGKTVVGIELMKVLLAKENRKSKIGPILTICFTNHALDQFLEHLLDEGMTNIVRLGSQTESERIREYNLEEVCKKYGRNKKLLSRSHMKLGQIEKDIDKIKGNLLSQWVSWENIQGYLKNEEKDFYKTFTTKFNTYLPNWVMETIGNSSEVDETEEESYDKFQTVRNRRNRNLSIFEQWLYGEDIRIINKRKRILLIQEQEQQQQQQQQQKGNENEQKKRNKKWMSLDEFEALNEVSKGKANSSDDNSHIDHKTLQWIKNYEEPTTNRFLDVLLKDYSIWRMSKVERQRLHDHWRTKINEKFVKQLSSLKKRHEEERQVMSDVYDEGNRKILLNRDVIGMTTSGAAKFQNLIKSINPKIIVCEEAGEVLEAHILSALTPSTQHLILIGDHNQLRPHIATYSLSMDSSAGKNYQLDKSLFERLVNGDNAVKIEKTQLLTQRRMRKEEISDLIRKTLYPNLIDGENTAEYSNVRGAQHNVYFIDHKNPEDNTGGDFAMKSHVNRYEVKMVVELVKHFVRNGYNKPEDIAVLTPYLGQMTKIRDALAELFVVVIDERDAQDIAELEGRDGRNNYNNYNTDNTSKTSLSQPITLRTVDNFQGEEANIVIISLVRNYSGTGERDSIGFLRSSNRSNVLLSRAREGMYLIGNSELMAKRSKDMWAPVIDILRKRNPPQVGSGIPIVCNKHPKYKNVINRPELFALISPDGGCLEKCDTLLPCRHPCIYKCHSDDPEHIKVKCNVPVGNVKLPCGHVIRNAKCWQKQARNTLKCMVLVVKKSPYCEHCQEVYCFEPDYNIKCREICNMTLKCGHECLNECFECQEYSTSQTEKEKKEKKDKKDKKDAIIIPNIPIRLIERTKHGECRYVCNRKLRCDHICKNYCHKIKYKFCPPCKVCVNNVQYTKHNFS
ncbi:hypothetical protein RclHR1_02350008 [Rhizophagus clarus]|uniref:P-loop containing nucleoside triphosphate hydrolase protein n=1 Tax=Rhizophagus clarus TaxID=94130 RepID=A0A2Z6R9N5_9GLOM|nr:hypothetical protein RclHR1_02350008 [Rhizophagus clarus]GES76010.1 P-loop containing nucleoside triphosphate hydrolase protein [Rhizophagus clarus]